MWEFLKKNYLSELLWFMVWLQMQHGFHHNEAQTRKIFGLDFIDGNMFGCLRK